MKIARALSLSTILFLVLTMPTISTQLNAMEDPTIATTICECCSCYYHNKSYNFTGFDTPCQHGLCPDCFLESAPRGLSKDIQTLFETYTCVLDFTCTNCKKCMHVGLKKRFEAGSVNDHIETLCAGFGHATKLVQAIDQLNKQSSPEVAVELLKRALSSRGRSLFDIKGLDDNTVLHDACRDRYSTNVIKIILQAAGGQAGNLVCVKNSWGQTALYFAVKNAMHYDSSISLVEELLNAELSGQARWNLINEKSLRHCIGGDCSVLMYAQTGVKAKDYKAQKLINLLKSYQPKDQ